MQSAAVHKRPEDLISKQVRLLALFCSFLVKDTCTLLVPVLHQGAVLESRLSFSPFDIWEGGEEEKVVIFCFYFEKNHASSLKCFSKTESAKYPAFYRWGRN